MEWAFVMELVRGFVVGVDDQLPALDEVLELPYRRSHGQELAVEGQIP